MWLRFAIKFAPLINMLSRTLARRAFAGHIFKGEYVASSS
jgi:glutamate dehydrogenase (NAD(P)+)